MNEQFFTLYPLTLSGVVGVAVTLWAMFDAIEELFR